MAKITRRSAKRMGTEILTKFIDTAGTFHPIYGFEFSMLISWHGLIQSVRPLKITPNNK